MPTICEFDGMKIQMFYQEHYPAQFHVVYSDKSIVVGIDERWLYGEVFELLKDPAFFSQMRLEPGDITISWPNGADFAPEFLYELEPEVVIPA